MRTVVSYELEPLSVEYLATHEIASAGIEESIFSNISEVREDKPLPTLSDVECVLLNGAEQSTRIGTAIVLRAMAGDKFSVGAYSYHAGKNIEEDNYTSIEEMFSTVLGTFGGGEGFRGGDEGGGGSSIINSIFNFSNYEAFNELKNSITNPAKPRAFLNYLVFDEEFNLNETASGAVQVGGTANAWEYLSMPADVVMPQNGFIAIYISNEEAMEVYFDNVTIIHTHGRLIEEQNYYPHGLLTRKTVAINGADPENKFQYQGKEMQDKIGLHLYDFHARQYDPQIGRFWGIDPADQFPSGYTGMGNDPANMIDPSGMYASNYSIMDRSRARIWAYNRRILADEAWAERAWRASRLLPKQEVNWGSRLEDGAFDVETARESFWMDYHHRAEKRAEEIIDDQVRAHNNSVKDLSKEGYVLVKIGKNTYRGANGEILFGKEAVEQYIKGELGTAAKEYASQEPTGGDADRTFEASNADIACSGACKSMTDGEPSSKDNFTASGAAVAIPIVGLIRVFAITLEVVVPTSIIGALLMPIETGRGADRSGLWPIPPMDRINDSRIKQMQKNGNFDPHDIKPPQGGPGGKIDLYSDSKGWIFWKVKEGEYNPTFLNMSWYLK